MHFKLLIVLMLNIAISSARVLPTDSPLLESASTEIEELPKRHYQFNIVINAENPFQWLFKDSEETEEQGTDTPRSSDESAEETIFSDIFQIAKQIVETIFEDEVESEENSVDNKDLQIVSTVNDQSDEKTFANNYTNGNLNEKTNDTDDEKNFTNNYTNGNSNEGNESEADSFEAIINDILSQLTNKEKEKNVFTRIWNAMQDDEGKEFNFKIKL